MMIVSYTQKILKSFDLQLIRLSKLNELGEAKHNYEIWRPWVECEGVKPTLLSYILRNSGKSLSQLQQDVFAEWINQVMHSGKVGFFVEFGATNGKNISNTYILEKVHGWNGILAEPATMWHQELRKNRSCNIETSCVYRKTGETVKFKETFEGEYSTIESYADSDSHISERKEGIAYEVQTISLLDLLKKYDAPRQINYLSIDTEGSEYSILRDFPFSQYEFDFISVEHNYNSNRELLKELFMKEGYLRIFPTISAFEDWYVSNEVFEAILHEA